MLTLVNITYAETPDGSRAMYHYQSLTSDAKPEKPSNTFVSTGSTLTRFDAVTGIAKEFFVYDENNLHPVNSDHWLEEM